MSMVSTQPTPPNSHASESAPAALPLEADPSGFSERAPALLSLLPDEALSLALARADAFALHAALTARLAREPSGPSRDSVQELLGHRLLFVMAERPPRLFGFLGCGVELVGLPPREEQSTPFIATRAVRLFGVPLWPLGDHLVQRNRAGQLEVRGRVAASSGLRRRLWVPLATLGGLGLVVAGLALAPWVVRDVQLANGLSRPVEVSLNGHTRTLQPGELVKEQVYSLGTPYHVEARWPGTQSPFETASVEPSQHALYNVLGAASLRAGDMGERGAPSPLDGRTVSLESNEHVQWQGDWERKVRDYENAGRSAEAANLAQAVFQVDPSSLLAAEEAARILARHEPGRALAFAFELQKQFRDEPVGSHLAQDLFLALGRRDEAFKLYNGLAREAPESLGRALLAARVAPPEQQRAAYARVLEQFPQSAEARREVARLRLTDGSPKEALKLLDEALAQAPEDVESLELRVRAMLALKQGREASEGVRHFAADPNHRSWELAVLAGRLAHVLGPGRTQYVTANLIPPAVAASPERLATFALLTGEFSVTDERVRAVLDPAAHDAIALTRTVLRGLERATREAATTPDKALVRLDPETAAVLGLELTRVGDTGTANRVFGTSLLLMAAREPLEAYVRAGEVKPDFPMLPPGLQAAAYLIRARAAQENQFVEQAYARWTDMLGGMARRALDSGYKEPDSQEEPSSHRPALWSRRRFSPIEIIRGTPPASAPGSSPEPVTAPAPAGDRLPRPWPVP